MFHQYHHTRLRLGNTISDDALQHIAACLRRNRKFEIADDEEAVWAYAKVFIFVLYSNISHSKSFRFRVSVLILKSIGILCGLQLRGFLHLYLMDGRSTSTKMDQCNLVPHLVICFTLMCHQGFTGTRSIARLNGFTLLTNFSRLFADDSCTVADPLSNAVLGKSQNCKECRKKDPRGDACCTAAQRPGPHAFANK